MKNKLTLNPPEQILKNIILLLSPPFINQHKSIRLYSYTDIAADYKAVLTKYNIGWNDTCQDIIKDAIQKKCPKNKSVENSEEDILKYMIIQLSKIRNGAKGHNCLNLLKTNKPAVYKALEKKAKDIIKYDNDKAELIRKEALQELSISALEEIEKTLNIVLSNKELIKTNEEIRNLHLDKLKKFASAKLPTFKARKYKFKSWEATTQALNHELEIDLDISDYRKIFNQCVSSQKNGYALRNIPKEDKFKAQEHETLSIIDEQEENQLKDEELIKNQEADDDNIYTQPINEDEERWRDPNFFSRRPFLKPIQKPPTFENSESALNSDNEYTFF